MLIKKNNNDNHYFKLWYIFNIPKFEVIHYLNCFNIPNFLNSHNHFVNLSIIQIALFILLNHYLNQVMAISLLIVIPLIQLLIPLIALIIILINIPILIIIPIHIIILIHIITLIHIIIPQLVNSLINNCYFQYYLLTIQLIIIQPIQVIHILLNFIVFLAFLPILILDWFILLIHFLNVKEVLNFKIMGVDQILFLNLLLLRLIMFSEIVLIIQALIILLRLYQFL